MSILNHTTRIGAIASGGLILALAAESTLVHIGDTAGPAAHLVRALALGLGIGAIAIGLAWHHRHRALAVAIGLALVCGEMYGLVSTAERIIAARETMQSAAHAVTADRAGAAQRVTTASTALAAANKAASNKAAERHCARECRGLLADAITQAGMELADARTALAAIPAVTASATPLADRTGLPAWAIDVAQAILASLAANGLAASLIAFGAHGSAPISVGATHKILVAGRDGPERPAQSSVDAALSTIRPSGQPSPRDVLQASFASSSDDAQRLAAFLSSEAPDGRPDGSGPPRGPGNRTKRRTDGRTQDRSATVITLPVRPARTDSQADIPASSPAAAWPAPPIVRVPIGEDVNRQAQTKRRDEVLASMLADLEAGRTFASQREICHAYDVSPSTLSDWLRQWEADGTSFSRVPTGRTRTVKRA